MNIFFAIYLSHLCSQIRSLSIACTNACAAAALTIAGVIAIFIHTPYWAVITELALSFVLP